MQILVPSFPTKTTTSAKQLSSSFPEDSLPRTVAAVGNALLQWPFLILSFLVQLALGGGGDAGRVVRDPI